MPTLIVLIGPTGVGKTELSLRLAENFHTSIVSADSRQLYAELNRNGGSYPGSIKTCASLSGRHSSSYRLLQRRSI